MSELDKQVSQILIEIVTRHSERIDWLGIDYYGPKLIALITEAAVMAVTNVADKELETSTPQDGEATVYYKTGYVQGCGASIEAIRALGEVKE